MLDLARKTALIIILMIVPAWAQSMDYNFTTKQYEFYDGSNWRKLNIGIGLVGCTKEGALDFDHLLSYYRYCNGVVWIPVVGALTLSPCSHQGEMEYFSSSYYYCNGLFWINMKGSIV